MARLRQAMQVDQERRRAAAAKRKARKKPSATQSAADTQLEDAETSLRKLFRQLASTLHPDREPDAQVRLSKTALMSEANAAYERRRASVDLATNFPAGTPRIRPVAEVGVSLNYEIDLWGRARRARESSRALLEAGRGRVVALGLLPALRRGGGGSAGADAAAAAERQAARLASVLRAADPHEQRARSRGARGASEGGGCAAAQPASSSSRRRHGGPPAVRDRQELAEAVRDPADGAALTSLRDASACSCWAAVKRLRLFDPTRPF
jgi:hypothetical protein